MPPRITMMDWGIAGWLAVTAAVAIALGVPPQLRALGRLRLGVTQPGPAAIAGAAGFVAIITLVAVLVGTGLAPRVGMRAPVFDPSITVAPNTVIMQHLLAGLSGGVLASISIPAYYWLAPSWLGTELFRAAEQLRIGMGVVARVALGGVVEELVFRWGVMTFIAWLLAGGRVAPPTVQWISIAGAALLFGAAHLRGASGLTGQLTPGVLAMTMLGNGWLGVVAGWLAWHRGILAAMVAHATVHVVWWFVDRARGRCQPNLRPWRLRP